MKTEPLPLALPMSPHQSAPRDRAIWITANVIVRDECFVSIEPFEGRAMWDERSSDWLDARGMSIRIDFDSEIRITSWCELAERAENAPEHERQVDAQIYFWDQEWRRENGTAGFFALTRLYHGPTMYCLSDVCAGPFATLAEARLALCGQIMVAAPGQKKEAA